MEFIKLIAFGVALAWAVFFVFDKILVDDIFAYSAQTGPVIYILAGVIALISALAPARI